MKFHYSIIVNRCRIGLNYCSIIMNQLTLGSVVKMKFRNLNLVNMISGRVLYGLVLNKGYKGMAKLYTTRFTGSALREEGNSCCRRKGSWAGSWTYPINVAFYFPKQSTTHIHIRHCSCLAVPGLQIIKLYLPRGGVQWPFWKGINPA